MMVKFSRGDKVRLRTDLNMGFYYNGLKWTERKASYMNIDLTIERADEEDRTYTVYESELWFGEDMFEIKTVVVNEGMQEMLMKMESIKHETKELKQEVHELKEEIKIMQNLFSEMVQHLKPQKEGSGRKVVQIK